VNLVQFDFDRYKETRLVAIHIRNTLSCEELFRIMWCLKGEPLMEEAWLITQFNEFSDIIL
tara:strand:- start:3144 stop:3326 length:183 start_codon:yes stop_codon:yes gene_type:complete